METHNKAVYVDADWLLYQVTEGKSTQGSFFNPEIGQIDSDYRTPMKELKKKFKDKLADLLDTVAANRVGELNGEIIPIFSDPVTNFRYWLYPEYKSNRKGAKKSDDFYRLRNWAVKKYPPVRYMEADDVIAHHVRRGAIGVSSDKDLLLGVGGVWFNPHYKHMIIKITTTEEAEKFTLLQTIAGDSSDGIQGLARVAMVKAHKLLEKHGWNWNGVVASYKEHGLTEKDAILTRRLVGMDQWSPETGLKLWRSK